MPTTTNFGWTTPADTDLVKDGAAAIRTLGSNIDTSLVDLKGGTTGQYLQKASGTDLDYVWADVSAGGMTLISSTTLTGATVTISSIPQTYKNLQLIVRDVLPTDNGVLMNMRMNTDSNANRHATIPWTTENGESGFNQTSFVAIGNVLSNSVTQNLQIFEFFDYANTVTWKYVRSTSATVYSGNTAQVRRDNHHCYYNQTNAITDITFLINNGTNFTSGTALLYGVK